MLEIFGLLCSIIQRQMQSPFELCYVPKNTQLIFVNDFLLSDLTGGAELTTDAIVTALRAAGAAVALVRASQLTPSLISENRDKLWVLCNYASADIRCIIALMQSCRYALIEYDFKFCSRRSPEKHRAETGAECNCAAEKHGIIVSDLLTNASMVVWMSEKQRDITLRALTKAKPRQEMIASSVFSDVTLEAITNLRKTASERSNSYAVLKSDSWVKGTAQSVTHAVQAGLSYELVGGLSYDELLKKLSRMRGIVYQPPGSDTCPRLIIEAKLLGLDVVVNDNVMHASESWFKDAASHEELVSALRNKRSALIAALLDIVKPRISGYVTTLDCVKRGYPIAECVESMTRFCTEIIICDGGSTDATLDVIERVRERSKCQVRVISHPIDMSKKDFALEDGRQKARARAACSMQLCWQQDADEIVDERDVSDILLLASKLPDEVDIVCLPVIEFWGSTDKIRADVTPWKWRLSRNKPNITHGVPRELRALAPDGREIALHGTDGCDLIDNMTGDRTPSVSFMSPAAETDRLAGLCGDSSALKRYETWFSSAVIALPPVFHVSWLDIERKLKLYREYWTDHWASLYGEEPMNNFFDRPWSKVSDSEIADLASDLKQIGGWIWHKPWDGSKTPSISIRRPLPRAISRMSEHK